MACNGDKEAKVDLTGGCPNGCQVVFKGEHVSGSNEDGKTNSITVEGKQTLIEGKNVKVLEWKRLDTFAVIGKAVLGLSLGIVFPPAAILMNIRNQSSLNQKLHDIKESRKQDFFSEGIRNQFAEKFNESYQDAKNLYNAYDSRITQIENRITQLEAAKASAPDGQKDAMESEISRLKAELDGDEDNPGLREQAEDVRVDLDQMKVAITEIKDASTQNGVPSIETLKLFNDYSSHADSKGNATFGDLYRDIKGAEGYFSFLIDSYMKADAPFASSVADTLANLDESKLTQGAIDAGISGLTVDNLKWSVMLVELVKNLPNDVNPRAIIPDTLLTLAQSGNFALSELVRPANDQEKEERDNGNGGTETWITHATISDYTSDPNVAKAITDFNKEFANAMDRISHLQKDYDKHNSHKNNDSHSSGSNRSHDHGPTSNPHDPTNPHPV